jgi:hypothetical protein
MFNKTVSETPRRDRLFYIFRLFAKKIMPDIFARPFLLILIADCASIATIPAATPPRAGCGRTRRAGRGSAATSRRAGPRRRGWRAATPNTSVTCRNSAPASQSSAPRTSTRFVCVYQCCGSGMFIPDPGSRIQKKQHKRGVKKKFFVITFYLATNFTKFKII